MRPVPGGAAARALPRTRWLEPSPLAIFAFIAGAGSFAKVNLVGEVYVAELLLPLLGIAAAASGPSVRATADPLFRRFMLAALLSLAGFMLSDLVRGSQADQYLRGWARIVFIIVDFLALNALMARDPRLMLWFALGMGGGGILYMRLVERLPLAVWKFGYSVPFMVLFCCLGSMLRPRLVAASLAGLGMLCVLWDSRIQGAVCFFLAAILWSRSARPGVPLSGARAMKFFALPALVAALGLYAVMSATQDDFSGRRATSDFGRSVGIRTGVSAILESPLIGWGSWAISPELLEISRAAIAAEIAKTGFQYYGTGMDVFHAHSQVLQAWMEGGVFGAGLFLFFGYQMIKWLRQAALRRPLDALSPLIFLYLVYQLWHLVQSPIGQNQRLHIAMAMAMLVFLSREQAASAAQPSVQAAPAAGRDPGARRRDIRAERIAARRRRFRGT